MDRRGVASESAAEYDRNSRFISRHSGRPWRWARSDRSGCAGTQIVDGSSRNDTPALSDASRSVHDADGWRTGRVVALRNRDVYRHQNAIPADAAGDRRRTVVISLLALPFYASAVR